VGCRIPELAVKVLARNRRFATPTPLTALPVPSRQWFTRCWEGLLARWWRRNERRNKQHKTVKSTGFFFPKNRSRQRIEADQLWKRTVLTSVEFLATRPDGGDAGGAVSFPDVATVSSPDWPFSWRTIRPAPRVIPNRANQGEYAVSHPSWSPQPHHGWKPSEKEGYFEPKDRPLVVYCTVLAIAAVLLDRRTECSRAMTGSDAGRFYSFSWQQTRAIACWLKEKLVQKKCIPTTKPWASCYPMNRSDGTPK